jgi:hypothetical protein
MPSAKVRLQEIDLSTRVPSFPGVFGAIVVASKKGPVNEPTLVTNDTAFLRQFTPDEKIDVGMDNAHFSALSFLEKSDKLWVVRAANGALFSGASLRSYTSAYNNFALSSGLADPTAYVFDASDDVVAVAEITKFTAIADVSSSIAGDYFTWHKAPADAAFYGWYQVNVPAIAEITQFTFSQAGSFYDVIGAAKALQLFNSPAVGHYFWFNVTDGSNVQTDPVLSGTGHQVNILTADTLAQVATKFFNAVVLVSAAFTATNPSAGVVNVTNVTAGTATDATATGSAAAILVSTQGAAATTAGADPAPGGTGIMITVNQNATATQVASATIAALAAHGAAAVSGQPTQFRITNAVAGAVTDATAGTSGFTVLVETQGLDTVDVVDEALLIYAANPGDWGDKIGFKITTYTADPDKVKEPGAFMIEVYKQSNVNVVLETWVASRVQGAKDGFNRNIFVEDLLLGSEFIRGISNPAVTDTILPKDQVTILFMGGGDDGSAVTDSQIIAALQPLKKKDNIPLTLILDGGHASPAVQLEIDAAAQLRGDCVGIFSIPYAAEAASAYMTEIVDYRKTDLNLNSSWSAIYSPHLKIFDRFNDRNLFISPDGFAAAAISATAANFEIWFPPAGFKRGLVRALETRRKFDEAERDVLYDNQINPIRFTAGKGIAIWGQKTLLARPSSLQSLNIRLLLIVVEPAVSEALQDFLFELNDSTTRLIAKTVVDRFMENIQARRGVFEFRTICDDSNNSAADVDANRMNLDLFVKPIGAVEEIVFRTIVTSFGISLEQAPSLI